MTQSFSSIKTLRVLIVEHHLLQRQLACDILNEQDCITYEAGKAHEAMAIIGKEPIDLVVASLDLPDLDGATLCLDIRAEKYAMPIILVTDNQNRKELSRVWALEGVDFLLKPFRPIELLFRLKNVLEHQQLNVS